VFGWGSSAAGLRVSASVAPVLPALTDGEEDLDGLMAAIRSTGVRRASTQLLFLRTPTKEKYLRWLGKEFPQYLEAYERAYEGHVYLAGPYQRTVQERVRRLRAKHGLVDAFGPRKNLSRKSDQAVQLDLWSQVPSPAQASRAAEIEQGQNRLAPSVR
jgi:DNA repair photolyase